MVIREKLITYGTQDTRRRQAQQKHYTICVGHTHTQTNTNIVRTIWAFLQTTGPKDDTNIVPMRESQRTP